MIQIIDNYFAVPELEVSLAMAATYKDYTFPTGTYPKFSITEDWNSLHKISRLVGRPLQYTLPPAYRKYIPGEAQPTFIHSDVAEGTVSAVIFLNNPIGRDNGLAFWKHKQTGMTKALLVGQEDLEYGQNEEGWVLYDFASMVFNRAVIFDSALYHSRYPKENWSVDMDNVRLVKVLFMKESEA